MINKTSSFGTVPLQVKGTSAGLGDGSQIFDIATTDGSTGTRLAFGVNEDNFGWIRSYESGVGGRDIVLAASDEKMRIKSDGKIGMGITNPQKNLHLYSSSVATVRIETGDSRGQAWDILSTNGAQNNTGTLSFRDESGNAYVEFGANEGSPIFRVRNGGSNNLLIVSDDGNLFLQNYNPGSSSFYPYMNVLNGQIKKYMQVKILNSGQGTKFTFTGTDRTSALITIKVSHSWTASNTSNRHGSAIYEVRIFTANGGSAGWGGITLIQTDGYSTGNFILSNESGYGYSITVNNPLSDSGISFCYDIEVMSASNTSKHSLTSVTVV